MPFAYYARLTRAQQAIYRKSDAIVEIRLPNPAALHPLVAALEAALKSEDRPSTQRATDALIRALCAAMELPTVRVEVLAARPHARWGELHGLYTNDRGKPITIQLWMRTAKQKRVVAFRTYLRTLLHEVGHHIDYTRLRLRDSLHTDGFYKRESSLFHQLVPERTPPMPTIEDVAKQPLDQRLARMARTPGDLAAAIRGQSEAALGRRPDAKNWAATEVICHLRDTEEFFNIRFATMLAMDDPKFVAIDGTNMPDRWAEDRQYLRNDAAAALAAFGKRREESLAFLRKLTPAEWQRAGIHVTRGRMTFGDFVALMAWHDDNHLDQLTRALDGRA
ncbi:MAG: DinB family protein [Candidatus Rokubacteria bacterium]|nr:DinB family protein [Candidatus Rokubacteria bacterium]